MNRGFWDKLKKPIMALAPMADVTDASFRHVIAKYGKPDVMFTEFVSADGLCSQGRDKLLVDFKYSDAERPIVAQIFGSRPENFYKAAQLIKDLKFDGIDINMGCPERSIQKQGSCAALIGNPALAKEIIAATKEGAGGLPVSVKTRIGLSQITLEEWLSHLLECGLAAITLHLRTRKEMSKVPAHWELMPQAVEMVKSICHCEECKNEAISSGIAARTSSARDDRNCRRPLILGNGDVMSLAEAGLKVKETGCDGVMLGRAIFGNPWLFRNNAPSLHEKLAVMIEHTYLYEFFFSGNKSFDLMKKHYKAYIVGFEGAKELRVKLMEAKSAEEVKQLLLEGYPQKQYA